MGEFPRATMDSQAARLMPCIDKEVRTPLGIGRMVRIHGCWAVVEFEGYRDLCHIASVEPYSVEDATAEPFREDE